MVGVVAVKNRKPPRDKRVHSSCACSGTAYNPPNPLFVIKWSCVSANRTGRLGNVVRSITVEARMFP